jgi:hypothetical protein
MLSAGSRCQPEVLDELAASVRRTRRSFFFGVRPIEGLRPSVGNVLRMALIAKRRGCSMSTDDESRLGPREIRVTLIWRTYVGSG